MALIGYEIYLVNYHTKWHLIETKMRVTFNYVANNLECALAKYSA